jgi:integrase
VVTIWDKLVRENLDDSLCWYAHLDSHGKLNKNQPEWNTVENRRFDFCDDLQSLCTLAGIVYKSAHKLRHGHAVYALKLCETVAQFKSVSQNLMHANMGITDGVYGNLVREDVHDTIRSLAPKKVESSNPELQALFEEMIRKYAKGKE